MDKRKNLIFTLLDWADHDYLRFWMRDLLRALFSSAERYFWEKRSRSADVMFDPTERAKARREFCQRFDIDVSLLPENHQWISPPWWYIPKELRYYV